MRKPLRQGLRFLVACFMYLREATKGAEEGRLHQLRHLLIINRLFYAVVCIRFILLFWKDGTIADAIGFYLFMAKGFRHAEYEGLGGHKELSCIAGKRLMACFFHGRPAGTILVLLYICT